MSDRLQPGNEPIGYCDIIYYRVHAAQLFLKGVRILFLKSSKRRCDDIGLFGICRCWSFNCKMGNSANSRSVTFSSVVDDGFFAAALGNGISIEMGVLGCSAWTESWAGKDETWARLRFVSFVLTKRHVALSRIRCKFIAIEQPRCSSSLFSGPAETQNTIYAKLIFDIFPKTIIHYKITSSHTARFLSLNVTFPMFSFRKIWKSLP